MFALAISPFQTGLRRGRTGLINQFIGLRGSEGGVPDTEINDDPVSERHRSSGQGEFLQVEGLRVERGLVDEEQIPLGVSGSSERRNQEAIDFAIQGSKVDAVLFGLRIRVVGGEVEKMLAVGKKEGPAVCGVKFRIQMGDGSWGATGRGDLVEDVAHCRRKEDNAGGSPSCAARPGG